MTVPVPAADGVPDAPRPPARPLMTLSLIAVFCAIYGAEMLFHVGTLGSLFEPDVRTLIAFGGVSRILTVEQGEWFRLLTAAFVHANLLHLAMNGFCMLIIGQALETGMRPLSFLALYLLGAVGGSLASITFNEPALVSIGASGAIMALFGFLLGLSWRVPKGAHRSAFQRVALNVLIPSIAPVVFVGMAGDWLKVDFAGHIGGAVTGLAMAGLSRLFWPRLGGPGRLAPLAPVIVLAALAYMGSGLPKLAAHHAEFRFVDALVPEADAPKSDADWRRQAEALLARFPNDPRVQHFRGAALLEQGDVAGAEPYLRAAVALAERHPAVFRAPYKAALRTSHAFVLSQLRRTEEARTVAAPVCALPAGDRHRERLRAGGLCPR